MPSLTALSLDELRCAGDAAETLIEFRDYLPTDGMLLMLAGRWRDDIRELLGVPPSERVSRGPERKKPEDMQDADLERLFASVILLVDGLKGYMDDPELPRHLSDLLEQVGAARDARIHAEQAMAL